MSREESLAYIHEWLKDEYALNSKDREALDMAIKALDQEHILDKIRAEIDDATEIHSDGEFYIKNIDVKRIIDKYREGSEGE